MSPLGGGAGKYEPQGNLSPDMIKAQGDNQARMGILWFIGIICVLLILGGFAVFIIQPGSAKDVWIIIGPILSAAVSGTLSYLAGERAGRLEH